MWTSNFFWAKMLFAFVLLGLVVGCTVDTEDRSQDSEANESLTSGSGSTADSGTSPDSVAVIELPPVVGTAEDQGGVPETQIGSGGEESTLAPTVLPEAPVVKPDQPTDPEIITEPGPSPVEPEGTIDPDPTLIEPGQVTIIPGKPAYQMGEVIAITVINGLGKTIFTTDMKTTCTVVILEKWDGANWQSMLNCGMERLPLNFAIEPGSGYQANIDPFSTHFGVPAGSTVSGIEEGVYRIRFTYGLESGEGSEVETAYSAEFQVGP